MEHLLRDECVQQVTHQIRGQSQSSQLSDTILGWFGLLLSCCTGLEKTNGDIKCFKLTECT